MSRIHGVWGQAWSAACVIALMGPANLRAQELLLDVRVNGQRLPEVTAAQRLPDGRLAVSQAVWQEMRLRTPVETVPLPGGAAGHALESMPGLRYTLDSRRLQLDIDAPPALFASQSVDASPRRSGAPARPAPGVVVNYDLALTGRSGGGSGGMFDAVAFGPFGSVSAGLLATASPVGFNASGRRLVRLDTSWQMDWPQRMESLVVGDAVGTGGGWSRPVRFGGIRFGRDFALQPGFVTMPMATLGASAALPSAVDVLVNGQQRMSQAVQSGPFEITNVPLLSGAGEVNLVVRDLLGRETVVRQSYYASPRILDEGVSDYQFELGRLRTGYGLNDSYGDLFGAATWRQGLRWSGGPSLTAEGRVEWMRERQAAGVEVAGLLGHWGVARGMIAGSSTPLTSGLRWGLGLERSAPAGGLQALVEGFGAGFTQLAATTAEAQPRHRVLLGGWMPLDGRASVAATWTRQDNWNAPSVGVLGVTLNVTVFRSTSLSLSLARQTGPQSGWRAGLALAVPLEGSNGAGSHLSSSVDRAGDGTLSATAHASQAAPAGTGLGWYLRASDSRAATIAGGVNYNATLAELSAEAQAGRDGRTDVRLGARGSLGYAAGLAFAARPLGRQSFAVVRVGEEEGVPVLRSHQVVAHTNSRGLALVPGLLPYEQNIIAIDTTELPLDAEVGHLQLRLTPFARSVAVADFGYRRRRSALLVLVQPDGSPVPAGARVNFAGATAPAAVANRGEVYLEGLPATTDVDVRWGEQRCAARVTLDDALRDTVPRVGPLTCLPAQGAWVAAS